MNSRQAINLLKGLEQSLDDYCELNDEGKAAFRMAIEALELFGNAEQLPSTQHWISCSERLPEESGLYIVTNVGRWVEPVGTRYYNIRANGGFWSGHPGNKVLAWMPLPEKYGGEQDG